MCDERYIPVCALKPLRSSFELIEHRKSTLSVPSENFPIEVPDIAQNILADPLFGRRHIKSFKDTIRKSYQKGDYSEKNKIFEYEEAEVRERDMNAGLLILPHYLQPEGYVYAFESRHVEGLPKVTRLAGPTCPLRSCFICDAALRDGIIDHMRQVLQYVERSSILNMYSSGKSKPESIFTDSSDGSRIHTLKKTEILLHMSGGCKASSALPSLKLMKVAKSSEDRPRSRYSDVHRDSTSILGSGSTTAITHNSDSLQYDDTGLLLACDKSDRDSSFEYLSSFRSMINVKHFGNLAATAASSFVSERPSFDRQRVTSVKEMLVPSRIAYPQNTAYESTSELNIRKNEVPVKEAVAMIETNAVPGSLSMGSDKATLNSPFPELFEDCCSEYDESYLRELEALTPRGTDTMMGIIDYALREGIVNINFRQILLRLERLEERTDLIIEASKINKKAVQEYVEECSSFCKKEKKKERSRYYSKTWRHIALGGHAKYRSRHWCRRHRLTPGEVSRDLELESVYESSSSSCCSQEEEEVTETESDLSSSIKDILEEDEEDEEQEEEEEMDDVSNNRWKCDSRSCSQSTNSDSLGYKSEREVNYEDFDKRSLENEPNFTIRSF